MAKHVFRSPQNSMKIILELSQMRFGRRDKFILALLIQDYNLQFKVLHRLFIKPYSIKCILQFPLCDRCRIQMGCILFGSALRFLSFGVIFFGDAWMFLEKISVKIFSFVWMFQALAFTHSQQISLMFGMVVAKRVILMDWKSTLVLSFHEWLTETVAALKLEIIHFSKIDASKKLFFTFIELCLGVYVTELQYFILLHFLYFV